MFTLLPQTCGGAAAADRKIKAVAFVANFDLRLPFSFAGEFFPRRDVQFGNAWRTRQFEYQWLRALSGRYADFRQATDDALVFSADMLKVDLAPEEHARLMNAYLELGVWPDVPPVLQALKNAGIRMAYISNATSRILDAGIKNAQPEGIFEHIISADRIKICR